MLHRFVVALMLVPALFVAAVALIVTPRSSMAEEQQAAMCDESTYGGATAHAFTGGACYQAAPSGSTHTAPMTGYCHQSHYQCPS